MKPMRLIYIYHSGFIIESKEFAILIDYYRDTPEFYVHRHFLKRDVYKRQEYSGFARIADVVYRERR